MKNLLFLPLAVVLVLLAGPALGYQNGAPTLTCVTCHAPVHDHVSTLEMKGVPRQYRPGKTYRMRLVVKSDIQSVGDVKGGFVVRASGGDLIVTDDTNTQLSGGLLTHTIEGSTLRVWRFSWKAPQQGGEPVEFAVMATASNGDFAPVGDAVLAEIFTTRSR